MEVVASALQAFIWKVPGSNINNVKGYHRHPWFYSVSTGQFLAHYLPNGHVCFLQSPCNLNVIFPSYTTPYSSQGQPHQQPQTEANIWSGCRTKLHQTLLHVRQRDTLRTRIHIRTNEIKEFSLHRILKPRTLDTALITIHGRAYKLRNGKKLRQFCI